MRRAGLGAWLLLLPAALAAQQDTGERTAVTVDYVSVDGIYLPIGADQGLVLGDTVTVYPDSVSVTPSGRLLFVSVTRRRSVAQDVDASLGLERGDSFFISLGEPTAAGPGAPSVPTGTEATLRSEPGGQSRVDTGGPRVSGRIALDIDARETRTSWSGDLFGETRRRFATPTSRLSLIVSDLPGGFSMRTSLRTSYRYDQLPSGPPPLSVRAYEAVAIRSFDAAQIMIGRFSNPYEGYSAYWDGVLLRVGGSRGPGLGVVAGFEPVRYNEGFSTELPKISGFADLVLRGDGWRYDTDVSVHLLRPSTAQNWSYAGWSQRISLGPLDLRQRLRIDGGLDGRALKLGDLRLRARLDVTGPLGVHASYGRSERSAIGPAVDAGGLTLPLELIPREDVSVGMDLRGRLGQLWIDVGQAKRENDGTGTGLCLRQHERRTRQRPAPAVRPTLETRRLEVMECGARTRVRRRRCQLDGRIPLLCNAHRSGLDRHERGGPQGGLHPGGRVPCDRTGRAPVGLEPPGRPRAARNLEELLTSPRHARPQSEEGGPPRSRRMRDNARSIGPSASSRFIRSSG